jgi:hypothetical protein
MPTPTTPLTYTAGGSIARSKCRCLPIAAANLATVSFCDPSVQTRSPGSSLPDGSLSGMPPFCSSASASARPQNSSMDQYRHCKPMLVVGEGHRIRYKKCDHQIARNRSLTEDRSGSFPEMADRCPRWRGSAGLTRESVVVYADWARRFVVLFVTLWRECVEVGLGVPGRCHGEAGIGAGRCCK